MKKIREFATTMQLKALCAIENFKNSERGDTNFVSMLLIIGIVVVLAGIFLVFGKEVINAVKSKVMDFINGL